MSSVTARIVTVDRRVCKKWRGMYQFPISGVNRDIAISVIKQISLNERQISVFEMQISVFNLEMQISAFQIQISAFHLDISVF